MCLLKRLLFVSYAFCFDESGKFNSTQRIFACVSALPAEVAFVVPVLMVVTAVVVA